MNQSHKHEARKQEILDTAFQVWGSKGYRSTSLSDLAAPLNMTKQALYRYFSSKEKLEAAMEAYVADLYVRYAEDLVALLEDLPPDQVMAAYFIETLQFFRSSGLCLGFLSYRNRRELNDPPAFREISEHVSQVISRKADVPLVVTRFMAALMFQEAHSPKQAHREKPRYLTIIEEGFATDKFRNLENEDPNTDKILSDASLIDFQRFGDDPLSSAVFEAVMEEAGSDVSLGKVARKAGLTKSSLYNYWPSKEAMLADVFNRQTTLYTELFAEFAGRYAKPTERLFAYFAYTGTFLRRHPEILNYVQRIMGLGLAPPAGRNFLGERFIAPLDGMVESGWVEKKGYSTETMLGIATLATVMEVKHHLAEESVRIRINQGIKDIHRLFVGGTQAMRRTM